MYKVVPCLTPFSFGRGFAGRGNSARWTVPGVQVCGQSCVARVAEEVRVERLMSRIWEIVKRVFNDWSDHDATRMGASMAFYAALSLSPLLLLAVAIAGAFFSRTEALDHFTWQLRTMIGPAGVQIVRDTVASAGKNSAAGWKASILSGLVLLWSASGVFGELRSSLNRIWAVAPETDFNVRRFLMNRIFSFGMVISFGFLLVASLIASALLADASGLIGRILPIPQAGAMALDQVVSITGITLVFALTYRYVPAAHVRWKEAFLGGLVTATLFTIGKYALAIYLAREAVGSAYGAAGSIVVLIVWIYYTAQIVFLGAEFTHVIGVKHTKAKAA